ncbi:MAG TPA: hypothetical protein VGX95_18185 [Xanthobacteraceae bacterium]|jgi:hypothetical protein|nr:hypothetical protein [Xanthobacteraceae bacterium]
MTVISTAAADATETSAVPIGLARLAKLAFDGTDLSSLADETSARALAVPPDPAALMDLSTIAQLTGRRDERLMLQMGALAITRVYRQTAATEGGLRLLAFMAPGDFLANTPLEFMLQDSDVTLDMLYVVPGWPLPQPLPAHDVAIVAATELQENHAVLDQVAALSATWPRPVLNAPDHIARLTRDGAWRLLRSVPGVVYPINVRIGRSRLAAVGKDETNVADALDFGFPIIVRPVDSHAGHGLALIAGAPAIGPYLDEHAAPEFFVAPFVDYRGDDGLYRKYRVALIDRRPYACHMAISHHWMIHYLNAGMLESAEKRAEEARFMAEFDHDFALRHGDALAGIAERIGLDYVTMDCAETRDGRLLVFEVGNGMIVHAMDPPALFPYKAPQMRKVFAAFEAMLRKAGARGRPAAAA